MQLNLRAALVLLLVAPAAASAQYFFDNARPRSPRQDAGANPRRTAGDVADANGAGADSEGAGFVSLAGAPKNPVIGKVVWVSEDGLHAVAWLDRSLAIPDGKKLGIREPARLGDAALVRVVRTHSRLGAQVRSLGLAVEKGAAKNGYELCVPARDMTARLEKLPPAAAANANTATNTAAAVAVPTAGTAAVPTATVPPVPAAAPPVPPVLPVPPTKPQ
ncbi:MAG: hypothetical protein LBT53_10220 [Puniceicoccales bacterium]|jgi:hypothetical protein|nr:hypothetical protein [Puniceicoccales bacterium]